MPAQSARPANPERSDSLRHKSLVMYILIVLQTRNVNDALNSISDRNHGLHRFLKQAAKEREL